jgi:hypothetical protein
MAEIFPEWRKAAVPLSGSRRSPAHDRVWVDCVEKLGLAMSLKY